MMMVVVMVRAECAADEKAPAIGSGARLHACDGLTANGPTIEYLIDLVVDVQTVRSCQVAAELDPGFTSEGYCYPNHRHVAAAASRC